MSEPRIQYAKTSDGVNIAYSVMGEGRWLVYPSNVWGDLQWYAQNEPTRRSIDALVASGWRVVRHDGRGMGASDRDVSVVSLKSRLLDLEAVVERVGADRFVLCGYGQGGPTAIVYSLRHPERVSHLVLVNSFARGADYYAKIPAMRALIGMRSMAESEWEFFTLSLASSGTYFVDAERARRIAAMYQNSMSAAAFVAYTRSANEIDLVGDLAQVSVPTLVASDSAGFSTGDLARGLAAGIPGASFVATGDYVRDLHSFVVGEPMPARLEVSDDPPAQSTAVILFADIVDSTALTERLGDAAFREKARDLDSSLRSIIREAGGTPIEGKLLGDGVLATFASARQAIEAALKCGAAGDGCGLPLHLGLHAGDVISEEGNVYGGAVTIAARISDQSAPGEVLVSQTVRDLARTSAGVGFEDAGDRELKGVGEPVRVWRIVPASRTDQTPKEL